MGLKLSSLEQQPMKSGDSLVLEDNLVLRSGHVRDVAEGSSSEMSSEIPARVECRNKCNN